MNTSLALRKIETNTEILVNPLHSHTQLIEFGKKQIELLRKAKADKYIEFGNGLTIMKGKLTTENLKVKTYFCYFMNDKPIGKKIILNVK
jgi:hypothetical protein